MHAPSRAVIRFALTSSMTATLALSVSLLAPGCAREGCLSGEEGCVVPSPCTALDFRCDDRSVDAYVVTTPIQLPGGLDALGAVGDLILENGQVVVVIEALDNPNFFSTTGGMITDLVTKGDDNDSITHIETITGLLPDDAIVYTSMELLPSEPGVRAVQLEGHLAGDTRQRAYTRYELRACDRGVRVRTELINGSDDEAVWALQDGYYWSSRSTMPFVPNFSRGFDHPPFGLGSVNSIMLSSPFMIGASFVEPAASYAAVGCKEPSLEGFHYTDVSVFGLPRRVVPARDYEIFERFIGVANGTAVRPGSDLALEVRRSLFGEEFVEVRGEVELTGGRPALGSAARAQVWISEGAVGTPSISHIPWTVVTPLPDGTFRARVPASRDYLVEVVSFGQSVVSRAFSVGTSDGNVGTLRIPAVGALTLEVRLNGDPAPTDGFVIVEPTDQETRQATSGYWGRFKEGNEECAPLLGPTWGGSPACNRILVRGTTTIDVPEGTYDLFATTGIFSTLQRTRVTVTAGTTETITFELEELAELKDGSFLSADFHVHGAKSFDTNLPDLDRVASFLAARIDVIAATDHDAVWDYAAAMTELQADERVKLLVGLETTGHALWNFNPEVTYPQVVGHYNFWPVLFDDALPRNGAAYDELAEPGTLFTRMKTMGFPSTGVIQLNHPWVAGSVGRDFGFPFALGLNLTDELPLVDDGTAAGIFVRKPEGAAFYNDQHDTQEVMNGTANEAFFAYRAFWFYLLNQGLLRAGTANSDSHTLVDNIVGTPRSLVYTSTTFANFDADQFNADVKTGRMTGTNGPIIDVSLLGSDGAVHGPSIEPLRVNADQSLKIRVRAAPWVAVDEIRVIVNGVQKVSIAAELSDPADPYGRDGVLRYDGEVPLRNLLDSLASDAWIVVEAGAALPAIADLDCDGVPDTSDNNDDGVADWQDVDRTEDGVVDDDDLDVNDDGNVGPGDAPPACTGGTGPLRGPPPPDPASDAFGFSAVTPGGYPLAFTNPMVLDLDGTLGFTAPGLPQ